MELLRQVNEKLMALVAEEMPLCPWGPNVFMDSSDAEHSGFSEALWDIVDPDYIRHTNLLELSQGKLRE